MPNRILKESICSSDTLDQLKWFEEVVFYRLLVNCDDYGRFDGRGEMLKSRLFPLKDNNVTVKSVVEAINRLATVGLVILYECDGKPYLQLSTWDKHQQVRAKKSKFPAIDETCKQMISDDCKCHRNPIQSESKSNPNPKTHEDVLAGFDGELRDKLSEWLNYKAERKESYRPTGLNALLAQIKHQLTKSSEQEVIDLIQLCMANGWKGITWDKLKPSAPQNASAKTGANSSIDMDRIHEMLHRGDSYG